MKNLNVKIAITLRKYRDKRKYSQQFVADCIGISRTSYRKWENNNVGFTVNQLLKIAELYDVSVEQIIKESYTIHNIRSKNAM